LEIRGDKFRLRGLPLKSVRPFMIDSITLSEEEGLDANDNEAVARRLEEKVKGLIVAANAQQTTTPPMIPLIRLKVDHTGFDTVNVQRFGQRFVGKVANPSEILLFSRRRTATSANGDARGAGGVLSNANASSMAMDRSNNSDDLRVEDLLDSFLTFSAKSLDILPQSEMRVRLENFVEKDDNGALAE
jgi:double-strand break repair protein MRE11